jgi:hypothetical protein
MGLLRNYKYFLISFFVLPIRVCIFNFSIAYSRASDIEFSARKENMDSLNQFQQIPETALGPYCSYCETYVYWNWSRVNSKIWFLGIVGIRGKKQLSPLAHLATITAWIKRGFKEWNLRHILLHLHFAVFLWKPICSLRADSFIGNIVEESILLLFLQKYLMKFYLEVLLYKYKFLTFNKSET